MNSSWKSLNSQDMKNEWIIPMEVNNNTTVSFKLDTGAQVNILPVDVYQKTAAQTTLEEDGCKNQRLYRSHYTNNWKLCNHSKAQRRISRATIPDHNRR